MTIALLFLDPLSRAYKAILMSSVTLIRSALLSLASTWSFAHAPMLTQSDFRVSEVKYGGDPQPGTMPKLADGRIV
jgi:hypothetical protein